MQSLLREARGWVDERFRFWGNELAWPEEIFSSARYAFSGGKAVRPALLFWTYQELTQDQSKVPLFVIDAAVGLEMIHAYSLIHDDLPCMDDDDFRRGRPTLHRLLDEGLALLVGDALQTGAFEVLSCLSAEPSVQIALIRELSRGAGAAGMVGGQWRDIKVGVHFERKEEFEKTHLMKTGALFGAAMAMGGLCAGLKAERTEQARKWGLDLGLLFQRVDDLLDHEVPQHLLAAFEKENLELRQKLSQEAQHLAFQSQKTEEILNFFTQRKS